MAPSSAKQRLFPGHRAFKEFCVVTQRAWRHYEQKLRDDWAIPTVTGGPVSTIFDKCLVWNSLIWKNPESQTSEIVRGPFACLPQARGGSVRLEWLPLNKSISEKEEKSLDGIYTSILNLRMMKNISWKDKV